jgi:hypothetical protein
MAPKFQNVSHNTGSNVKLIRYQFICTRCVFRLLESLQWYSGRKKLEIREKNCENCIRAEKKKIVCHETEPNLKDRAMHEGDNPSV